VNFQDFRAHSGPFPVVRVDVVGLYIVSLNSEMYHIPRFRRSSLCLHSYYADWASLIRFF